MFDDTNGDDNVVLLRTIPEVQKILRASRSKIYDLGAEGRLELVKLGRSTRITDRSIKKLVSDLIGDSRAVVDS
jgi:excisionase family DNA binding protein